MVHWLSAGEKLITIVFLLHTKEIMATQRYHQPVTPVYKQAAFLLGITVQQAGGGSSDTGKSNFHKAYSEAAKGSCFSQSETVWVALTEYSYMHK